MSRAPEPLSGFTRRIPEAGRIRYGAKTDKGFPKALESFRFTSSHKPSIELLAERYGGNVRPWSPGKGNTQFEVLTPASEIDVVVPPNALGDTPVYELWSGGGLVRRCDGERCMAPFQTTDGVELADQACVCEAKGEMMCKPVTRVSLLIPDIPFNGVWRLEAKGWNAAHELPGMIELVGKLTERGLSRAQLALEKRTSVSGGQTRHFVVPVVRMPTTLEEILEGGASLRSIGAGQHDGIEEAPALGAGSQDDEIAEAELVDEDPWDAQIRSVRSLVGELGLMAPDVAGFVYVVSEGEEERIEELNLDELKRVGTVLTRVRDGALTYQGLNGRRAVVTKVVAESA